MHKSEVVPNFSNMTRYARSKGSKASNERVPNDATPWHIMKQQLVENLSVPQESSKRTKSAKELLHDKQYSSDVAENNNSSWAEFENNCESQNNSTVKTIKKKHNVQQLSTTENAQDASLHKNNESNTKVKQNLLKRNVDDIDNSVTEVKSKKHKKKDRQDDNVNDNQKKLDRVDANIDETDTNTNKLNKKRNKNKCNTKEEPTKMLIENNSNSEIKNNEENYVHDSKNKVQGGLTKRQKRNLKKRQNKSEARGDIGPENFGNSIDNNKNYNTGNSQAKGFNRRFEAQSMNTRNVSYKFGQKSFENNKHIWKPPKIRDDKEHKRRKPDVGYSKMVINGVEVEIVKFDGFPVRKDDADRLHELKQKMIMKGIPEKDIQAAMKLERRKAEKALARIKKCVCFHCRKAGHNLSDCPELQSEQAGTGICFKCGSTEHTHFECKVAKPTEFRYATCFICREQGHIAKQCPDNPKGVYPQGGCCKICGDVTHLKKDCPDLIKEKEENTVTLNTIVNGDIESLEENKKVLNEKDDKFKKIVKF